LLCLAFPGWPARTAAASALEQSTARAGRRLGIAADHGSGAREPWDGQSHCGSSQTAPAEKRQKARLLALGTTFLTPEIYRVDQGSLTGYTPELISASLSKPRCCTLSIFHSNRTALLRNTAITTFLCGV